MASRRKERLADQVRDIVSTILLFELQDPRMGFVTVTGVDLSGDLRQATVKVSVLGDQKEQVVTMNVIRHARGYVQKLLAEKLNARFVPAVSFELDDSIKRSIGLSKTLRESQEN
jgi:ribosome-binding factor A